MSKGSRPKYILEKRGECCKGIPRASEETDDDATIPGQYPNFC